MAFHTYLKDGDQVQVGEVTITARGNARISIDAPKNIRIELIEPDPGQQLSPAEQQKEALKKYK